MFKVKAGNYSAERRDHHSRRALLSASHLLLSTSSLLLILLLATTGVAQTPSAGGVSWRYTLLGTIGPSYLIRMDLERNGEVLQGSYLYERAGVVRPGSNRIALTGRIDSAGRVSLDELTEGDGTARRRTGEFSGALSEVVIDGQPQINFAGTWTRLRDGRKLPFKLQEIGEYRLFSGGSRLTSRERREDDRLLNYTIRHRLPVLGGPDSAFNRHLSGVVDSLTTGFKRDIVELRRDDQRRASEIPPGSLEIDYVIVQATSELLSLQLSIYSYTGGAHPNSATRSINWDLRREREFDLTDLFTPGSAFGRIIADYCRRELGRLDIGDSSLISRGTAFSTENYLRWNPTRAGLRVTFDPYQVAAYAQGAFEVVVPWSLLRPYLRPGLLFLSEKTL